MTSYRTVDDPAVAALLDELIHTQQMLTRRIETLEDDLNTVFPARSYSSHYECNACTHQCEEY